MRVVRSESSTSGRAPGLGFWINSGLKWVIDSSSNLKPWTDEAYNIGTFSGTSGIGLRPATVYAAGSVSSNSGFELGKFANNSYELCDGSDDGERAERAGGAGGERVRGETGDGSAHPFFCRGAA